MFDAIIMSGGKSERMKRTNNGRHKALVDVQEVPLLERNLQQLIEQGFDTIYIAISSKEVEIGNYIDQRVLHSAQYSKINIEVLTEVIPLGTIGAIRKVPGDKPLVVVNVDNLSSIDLPAMASYHLDKQASLTIATHKEPFQIPFGELCIEDGCVLEYREKPTKYVVVSSGTYVVGPAAKKIVEKDARTDITDVYTRLMSSKRKVVAYTHSEHWIDINDKKSLEVAEANLFSDGSYYQKS